MMETTIEAVGFALCDSSAVRAVSKRRIGSLPYSAAFGAADLGEAQLADGRRVLVTWGRNIGREEQFWFAHHTVYMPIWLGSDDGACELIVGETFGSSPAEDWLWLGMRIERELGVTWVPVREGGE